MGLIQELHGQHREIKEHLTKIQKNEDPEVVDNHFKELKTVLISHLINEDNHLYPVLRSLEETKQISDSFEEEMGEISTEVMEFYARYEPGEKSESFNHDIANIISRLVYRIIQEERVLYPTFKRFFPNK